MTQLGQRKRLDSDANGERSGVAIKAKQGQWQGQCGPKKDVSLARCET